MTLPFPVEEKYYHYSRYLHERFQTRVYRVSVDGGFTCPTRDGTKGFGGCLYCSNDSFAPKRTESLPSITDQVKNGMALIQRFHRAKKFLCYFQPYTNTYAPVEKLERLYREALSFPDVVGLCIGTRPDCVPEETLQLLENLNNDSYISIEFGIESIYDKTLQWVNRGHDFAQTCQAIHAAKAHGLHVSGHLILGFPTETSEEMLAMADVLNNLELDALKIHHLHVVKNTPLAKIYAEQPFRVFSESEWISLVADFLERLRPDICIQRLCGEAKAGTLVAPVWHLSKNEVIAGIRDELTRRGTWQGYLFNQNQPKNKSAKQ
ncbi:MAG: TIGR01212 family radical SAM protein [Candidatus Marinimicrobia bacterium CG08_land_8_20_14_0_20_45_22]|nr:MAG: TIGR01212 family radical SAM protein [Candidatus Marinimicrobia bacterium CG08_land_8_20_14_0_20_45_22]